jgi:glucoamylase
LPWTTGLGEPKFNVDGSAFTGAWGRPQNDGPALRVITLARFANLLLDQGQDALVKEKLYAFGLPANTVIKADLEYISHYWQMASFDLWEEVLGTHFFTRMAIRKALLDGAALADRMGDPNAAEFYRAQAQDVQGALADHWDATRGYLVATLDANSNDKNKISGLDAGVILGSLIGCEEDQFFCPSSDQVLATAYHLQQSFAQLYPINQVRTNSQGDVLGTAIGRYPEDTYTGTSVEGGGNPWFILTNAFAELCYRASKEFDSARMINVTSLNLDFLNSILAGDSVSIRAGDTIVETDLRFQVIVNALHTAGDRYLNRVRYHTDAKGSLTEQMNRYSGFMQGARDLTWSYSSFLDASWAR